MPPNVKVCINGFVLSTLLFDCSNDSSDQEGFLYGSITRNVRREISDHSMSNTQEDILISICSSVPSGNVLSFYNNVGEIKRDELENVLGERTENIVGWYRFRRSAMFPSIREQSTHRHLRDLFGSYNKLVDTSYFVFGISSSSNLSNHATHSYDYGFFIQRRDGTFKDLPLTILNLGDTRNSYRSGSMALPFMNSSSFNSVLQSSWNFENFFETENQIHKFHKSLRTKLESLQEELAASDAVNASLEDDIKRLSNEMQALLAMQEQLAKAVAQDLAEANAAVKELEVESENVYVATEDSVKEQNEKEEKAGETVAAVVASEGKISEMDEKEVLNMIVDADEVIETSEIEIAASTVINTTENQKCNSPESDVDYVFFEGNEEMDDIEDSGFQDSKIKASPSGLKRASAFPFDDDRSSKRACPDKYFAAEECLNEKSITITDAAEQEEAALNTSHTIDPDNGESSPLQNKQDNMKLEDASVEIEEPMIPSPASNVEIIISDTRLQSFGSVMIVILSAFMINCIIALFIYGLYPIKGYHGIPVNESTSSSDDLTDVKECESKEAVTSVNDKKSLDVLETSKSLSDSDICCKKEVLTSNRCGSAPAEFLSHMTSTEEDKLNNDGSASKAPSLRQSSSRVNPPFIIYAAKDCVKDIVLDDANPCAVQFDLKKMDSKPEKSFSSQDQENMEKKDGDSGKKV